MGYVLYEFQTSGKMDSSYFQVGRTLRERGLFKVCRFGGLPGRVQKRVHLSTRRLPSHKPPRVYRVLPKESLPRRLHQWVSGPCHRFQLHGPKYNCRQVPLRAQPPNLECCHNHGVREALWHEPHKVVWDGTHSEREQSHQWSLPVLLPLADDHRQPVLYTPPPSPPESAGLTRIQRTWPDSRNVTYCHMVVPPESGEIK